MALHEDVSRHEDQAIWGLGFKGKKGVIRVLLGV